MYHDNQFTSKSHTYYKKPVKIFLFHNYKNDNCNAQKRGSYKSNVKNVILNK